MVIFRTQVPFERLACSQWNRSQFKRVEGSGHVSVRLWATLGAVESGVKMVAAAVTALVRAFFSTLGWSQNGEIHREVAVTQFNSFWRCALAVYSPNKAFQLALDGKNWNIGAQNLTWGTEYKPDQATLADKMWGWTILLNK